MRKKIQNYTNYYIYDNGDVLNIKTEKILKGSIGENGYKYYRLSENGNKKMYYAHRLVAEAFLENPNNLLVVNHKDGNKLNNNVDNLEWVTYAENITHAHSNKLIQKRKKSNYYKEDLENEQWKKIFNYHYSISSYGRIRNDETLLLLSPTLTSGYQKVRLSSNGIVKDFQVHYLVYCIFNEIDSIPKGYVIDHIDANKINNKLENLRLLSLSENVKMAYYIQKVNNSCKKVRQMDLQGKYIKDFPSCAEAARQLNLDSSAISKVCRGKNRSHGGYTFIYIE